MLLNAIKIKIFLLVTLALACNLVYAADQVLKIGVLAPVQHPAMEKIISGFSSQLTKTYKGKVQIDVQNAMGDVNLQRSILQKFKLADYYVIAPIGVSATNMTAALIKNKIIIGLAADDSKGKSDSCKVHVVHDEINNVQLLKMIKSIYPDSRSLMLVYSNTDKIRPQAKDFIAEANNSGIKVIPVMVNNISEINVTVTGVLAGNKPSAIVVLKDTTLVTGISYLVGLSKKTKIPLVVSDEGSVQNGAGIGLGVTESQIGVDGAILLNEVLGSKDMCSISDKQMTDLTIFINSKDMFGTSAGQLQQIAKSSNYKVKVI